MLNSSQAKEKFYMKYGVGNTKQYLMSGLDLDLRLIMHWQDVLT